MGGAIERDETLDRLEAAARRNSPDPPTERGPSVVRAAATHLEERRREVNDLNVFPVADGDTGDNMALTLHACLDEVDRLAREEGEHTLDEQLIYEEHRKDEENRREAASSDDYPPGD